ncbi:MAG: hypothetical protein COV60_03205 [Candidatus Magasanikbacteria bacterium CG11_big_fil_rev_8_21_14_0_20_43_7]|uniref:YbaK/aminoacyl-tRNA synthetase-associated domain-containing protein n=1 Tax=Candidatus Magasanikbacteria bacterium CG11_big_fil_rev_8_21_14_0_20_43_7 TaxID=1974654 RepID=A0A2H0N1X7_9BACT|nr:MAG: hypothetical protein COV60_03205 [Candidatus Magasanikbacteria bacterium CG11_big_fil_rev_8_21_14_0_20_43_7]
MNSVEQYLQSHDITYIPHTHRAVFTCEEAEQHCADIPGLACKNLFLRNKKRSRYFLLVLPAQKKIDIKAFAEIVGEKNKLTFASADELRELLRVDPGSVSVFGILNDKNHDVELYIDKEVYDADVVSFHPNVNTKTLELDIENFHAFLETIKQQANIVQF